MIKRNFYLGAISIIVILIAFLTWTLFRTPAEEKAGLAGNSGSIEQGESARQELAVPNELLGAQKVQEMSGPTAIDAISQMHKTGIDVVNAYIVSYGKADAQITLWLSLSPSEEEAAQLFAVMDQKVPASAVFTGREPVTIAGREVIKVNGMGQEHFYWQEGSINYWVAIQGEGDREALIQEVRDKVK